MRFGKLASLVFAVLLASSPARGGMMLTQAGKDLGLSLTTFAYGFPYAYNVGPLGIAFTSTGGVLVTDYPGHIRLFATDRDNQMAPAPLFNYGPFRANGLTTVGSHIYMAQQAAGTILEIGIDGGIKRTIETGLNVPLALVTNPTDGHLFVSSAKGIFDVNPLTKAMTLFAPQAADGLSMSLGGSTLYAESDSHILGYDVATRRMTFDSGYIAGGPDGTAAGIGPLAGNVFSNDNDGSLVEINLATKKRTLIATGGSRGDFMSIDPHDGTLLITQTGRILRLKGATFVPEPSSFVLVGLGGLGLLAAGFRRAGRRAGRDRTAGRGAGEGDGPAPYAVAG